MTSARVFLLALVVHVGACARSRPPEYAAHADAAEKAYSSGRYREAAGFWLSAVRVATEPRARVEAEFRAAASFERARDFERAKALYDKIRAEPSERSERASFARAYLEIDHGDAVQGHRLLERALLQHPNSGVADAALDRHLAATRERGGSEAVLKRLEEIDAKLRGSELAEHLSYARALELERLGATLDARDAFLETATRFPYPHGAYWDDALYKAAQCELVLGRPEAAVAHLERMLADREQAHLQGSYERTRFAQARFLIAETCRDKLGQLDRARGEFRRIFTDHPTSLLADDALWNEALTAQRAGNGRQTCAPLSILLKNLPDSRFAPCARALCPSLPELPSRRCHAYLMRQVRAGDESAP